MSDDLDHLSVDDLDAIMRGMPPPALEAPEAAPDATGDPEPAAAEAPEAAEIEQPAQEEEIPPAEPEPDWRALAEERAAKLEEAQQHAARLAGAKGHFERLAKKLADARGVEIEDASDGEEYGNHGWEIKSLRGELAEVRTEQQRQRLLEQDRQMMDEEYARVAGRIDDALLRSTAARHREEYADVVAELDPDVRALKARALITSVVSEASGAQLQQQLDRLSGMRTAATARNISLKRAQTISGSGGVPPPPPRAPAAADLTAEEADAWLRENVR